MRLTYNMAIAMCIAAIITSWVPLFVDGHFYLYVIPAVLLLVPVAYDRYVGLELA